MTVHQARQVRHIVPDGETGSSGWGGGGEPRFLKGRLWNALEREQRGTEISTPSTSLVAKLLSFFVSGTKVECQMEPGKTTEGDLEELSLLTSPLCLLIPIGPSLHVMGSLVNGTVYMLPPPPKWSWIWTYSWPLNNTEVRDTNPPWYSQKSTYKFWHSSQT